jgi:hypothetical protein
VAKLCRLGRDVHFISGSWRTACRFLVAEMGSNVDPFTLHVYASLLRRNAPSSVSGPRRPLRQPSAAVGSSARPAASRRQRARRRGQERTGYESQRHHAGGYCGDPADRQKQRWQPSPSSWKLAAPIPRQVVTVGRPCRYRGCWPTDTDTPATLAIVGERPLTSA